MDAQTIRRACVDQKIMQCEWDCTVWHPFDKDQRQAKTIYRVWEVRRELYCPGAWISLTEKSWENLLECCMFHVFVCAGSQVHTGANGHTNVHFSSAPVIYFSVRYFSVKNTKRNPSLSFHLVKFWMKYSLHPSSFVPIKLLGFLASLQLLLR